MVATPIAQLLKPIAQRRRDMADQILALQGQLRVAQGIKVIHVAVCGHADCGCPPPKQLPEDAWIVHLSCKHNTPQQVSPELLDEQSGATTAGPTPEQAAAFDRLMAMAQANPKPSVRYAPIHR